MRCAKPGVHRRSPARMNEKASRGLAEGWCAALLRQFQRRCGRDAVPVHSIRQAAISRNASRRIWASGSLRAREMEFEVKDMSCDGCANSISHAVTGADPVAKLDIDVATKVVRIESAPPSERCCRVCFESIARYVVVRNQHYAIDIAPASHNDMCDKRLQRRWNRFVGHQQEGTRRLESSE
jgi:copper chaperone